MQECSGRDNNRSVDPRNTPDIGAIVVDTAGCHRIHRLAIVANVG
jgi:hypothetical protein